MSNGLLTPEEAANAMLRREAQPVTLGPEALIGTDLAAQGGIPAGATTIEPLPEAVLERARSKFSAGEPLSQAELDIFTQDLRRGEGAEAIIPESARRILGKVAAEVPGVTAPMIIPGALTAAGGALGTAALGPGPGTLAGATAGSVIGTELNFLLGLEKKSDLSRVLSVLAPGVGAGVGRVGRSLAKATPAGQALRSGFAAEISERAPDLVFKAPGKQVVNNAFDTLRASGQTLNIEGFGRELNKLRGLDADFAKKLIKQLENAGPEAKAAIAKLSPTGPQIEALLTRPGRFDIDIGDVAELRKAVKVAKDAAFSRKGLGKVAAKRQAQEFTTLSNTLDDIIDTAAAAGDPAAQGLKDANLLARIDISQKNLTDLFNSAADTQTLGNRTVNTFNVNKIDKQLEGAKRALRTDGNHKFADLVKTMDEVGELKNFEEAMKQLRRLSPGENPQLIGESFGVLTRAANVAGRAAGLNLIGEAMLNPVARNALLRLVGATQGKFTVPILATAVAMGRAATGEALDETSEFILNKLASDQQLATEAEIQEKAAPTAEQLGLLKVFSKRPTPPGTPPQDIRPAGPIFGPRP